MYEDDCTLDKPLHLQMAEQCPDVAASIGKNVNNPNKKAPAWESAELDLLALFFTVLKIDFVRGNLVNLPRIVARVEEIRHDQTLHTTHIRNEHAYWCCVSQLLTIEGVVPSPTGPTPIYLVGDSHSLSPSWRTLTVHGESHVLHNKLVTGLKAWHLRPESTFYPKRHMECTLASIPNGAQAIFIFGEIDCREGLLVAIEKCRYKDLQEGIDATLDIYVEYLLSVLEQKDMEIFVHPVNSVINETRHIVKAFNITLAERIIGAKHKKLHWLDFFSETLTPDGALLRDEYNLDGTHSHPAYLELVAKAVEKCKPK